MENRCSSRTLSRNDPAPRQELIHVRLVDERAPEVSPRDGSAGTTMFRLSSALCEKRKVSDSYDPWFFRGLGVSPSHNTLPRVGSADREIWRPLKSQGKIAHLTAVSFRKVQLS